MKANTLLRQHGIAFKSVADALSSQKVLPFNASINPQSQMSTLSLTLDVLPGTTIKVVGSLSVIVKLEAHPISDSFQLSVKINSYRLSLSFTI